MKEIVYRCDECKKLIPESRAKTVVVRVEGTQVCTVTDQAREQRSFHLMPSTRFCDWGCFVKWVKRMAGVKDEKADL